MTASSNAAIYEGPESLVDDLAAFLFGHGHGLRALDEQWLVDISHPVHLNPGRCAVAVGLNDALPASEAELTQLIGSAGFEFAFLNAIGSDGTYGLLRARMTGEAVRPPIVIPDGVSQADVIEQYGYSPATVYFEPLVPPVPVERT